MNPYELNALNKLVQHLDDNITVHTERIHENIQFKDRLNYVNFSRGTRPSNTPVDPTSEGVSIMLGANEETTMYAILVGKNGPFDKEAVGAMGIKIAQYSDTEEDIAKLATFINGNI